MRQLNANTLVMVYPDSFAFNEEAYLSNKFQQKVFEDTLFIRDKVIQEFNDAVRKIESYGVSVIVSHHEKEGEVNIPDAIFPNNWFSTHRSKRLVTYPMAIENRRLERDGTLVKRLCVEYGYEHKDYSFYEEQGLFLEGTGSVVFDHKNKVAYGAISPRTHLSVFKRICEDLGYFPVDFIAFGKTGEKIYHTNVMLTIGNGFVLVGEQTILPKDRSRVLKKLSINNEIIGLSNEQVYNAFAGNMLQLVNKGGRRVLVMSSTAEHSLTAKQRNRLLKHNDDFCVLDIPIIEKVGGGSARCMLAEIY